MIDLSDNRIRVERDTQIYRVFPIWRAVQLFQDKQIGLVQPSLWDDPFENFFLNAIAVDSHGTLVSLESLRDDWYGQCWTATPESDAMWRIYSGDKFGVRLSTTVGKLFDAVCGVPDDWSWLKFFIGGVEYLDEPELVKLIDSLTFSDLSAGASNASFAETLLIKRTTFKHEDEVRVLFNDVHNVVTGRVATFPIDPKTLFDDVLLDPRLDDPMVKTLTAALRILGVTAPIQQSDLYRVPKHTIKLEP